MFSHLIISLILAGANPAEKAPELFQDLGEQLVESLRNDDIVDYAHCWASYRRLNLIAQASKEPVPKDELKAMKPYFQERNQQVAHSFKVLSDLLKKEGDLKHLELVDVSIQGKIEERGGLRHVTMFYVAVTLGEARYKITIDDGFEDSGTWYFSDEPLYIEGGPNNEHVSLRAKEEK